MDSKNDSLIGKQLGIYQVQAKLGQGGMARVYKAYHPHLRREVAIKVILAESADLANFQVRFKLEAQMIASLDHPNIVRVYDFGEENDLAYLVMQYVSGGTLREQQRGQQPLDPLRATRYAIQMAQALHHAHQHGIIHRDVKPQNMLISSTDTNQLLLSDFGIAKLYYQSHEAPALTEMPTRNMSDFELSSVHQIIGTADYMAPEQARGQKVDARTDVYALGVVLFQMLTGDKPFHADSIHGLLVQHVTTPPPWVSASNPRVPEVLAHITAKALAKAPADRFQTAEEMAFALEQVNSNATNRLASFPPYTPQNTTGGTLSWTPSLAHTQIVADSSLSRIPPITNTPAQANPYATIPSPSRGHTRQSITLAPGEQSPSTSPNTTGIPQSSPIRRPFPLSYLLIALVVIAGLVVLGMRILPGLSSGNNSNALSTPNGTVQTFHEQFQNNRLNWLVGNITPGVTLSTPGAGAYTATISTSSTAFPYPQAVELLPDIFTLTATLQQTAGAADDFYGIAFHFVEDNSGHVSCYTLIIDNNGDYLINEYNNTITPTEIASGTYPTSARAHTLKVKAQGNSYAFFIDQQALQITLGAQAPSTTWSNKDLSSGRLTLLFTGPKAGEKTTSFEATDVQLSIP
jgi:serine/threonine protein kinase